MSWLIFNFKQRLRQLYGIGISAMIWFAGLRYVAYAEALTFDNPIEATDFATLIKSIAESVIAVGIPLAVLALVFAAFQFVSGSLSDNPGKIKQAKQVFWFTLIGVAILVGAWAIATAVVNFAKEL